MHNIRIVVEDYIDYSQTELLFISQELVIAHPEQ